MGENIMPYTEITMNLSALSEIPPLEINVTGAQVFSNIVTSANDSTLDYYILAPLFIIFIIVYLSLSDKTPFQDFGYDDARGANMGLCAASLIGLTLISGAWSNNFYAVGMFITAWFLSFVLLLMFENKD